MRTSNLIQKPQERVKDQNDSATEARDNNMTSLIHQRNGEQDKPSHRDQGKSSEWEDRKKDEFP